MAVKNRRVFELRLGKVGLIVFIGGMSVLLFSLFLLGVVVGKHMEAYPDRYASGITELIRDRLFSFGPKQAKGTSAADTEKTQEAAGGGTDFGLTFYDTLGGKRGAAAGGAATGGTAHKASGSIAEQASPAVSSAENGPPSPGQSGAAREAAPVPAGGGQGANATPNPRPVGEGGGQPPPAEAGRQEKGRFEVQVAAYRERHQAERMVKRLAALGFPPRVVAKDLPGKGRWFRVIVGGFESRHAAEEAADQITGKIDGLKSVIRAADRNGNGE